MMPLPKGPILPQWATDKDVEEKVDELLYDIEVAHKIIDHRVSQSAPRLIAEAESWLKHETEGW